MRRAAVALLVVVAAVGGVASAPADAAGPGDTTDPQIVDGTLARDLADARKRWHAQAPASYRFDVTIGCFCAPPANQPQRVTVRRRKAVKPPLFLSRARLTTVREAFAKIDDLIAMEPAGLEVKYDATTGQPLHIAADNSLMVADDEAYYTFSAVKRLR